ncbi:MAG: cadherin-like beta sandwich domain-containing protein [Clostridia bacterium]|nr:cadherin-like beta sandwich domain-containing protein [Clostridia bacterium]
MNKFLKRIIIFATILCIMVSGLVFTASAASSSLSFSKNSIAIGETLTVTASFSNASAMYALEGYITYDPDVIQFVSGENCNKLIDGKVKIVMQSAGKTSLKESVQFKSLAAGSCKIALENLLYVDSNDVEQTLSGSAATLTVTNPSATASSNANLASMRVSAGELNPAFSKDVTTYSVTIPNDVTELLVNVRTEDRKATATVEGSKDMKVGSNKRVLVVTAENGNQKRYTINITRLDATGQVPDTPDTPDEPTKTEVVADGQTMYIEENFSPDIIPSGFTLNVYIYNGVEVPSITDNNIVMLYLTMPDGSGGGFYVVNKDASFSKMTVLTLGGVNYFIMPAEEKKIPVGYTETEITVNEQSVTVYKSEDAKLSDFVLIYAKGPSSYTGLYRLDTAEMTIQRAEGIDFVYQDELNEQVPSDDILANINNLSTNGRIVAITIVAIIVLLIAAIVILIVKIATSGKNKEDNEEELDDTGLLGFDFVTMDDREEK